MRVWNEEKLHWQKISRNGSVPPFSLLKNVRNCCKRPVFIATLRPLTLEIIVKAPFFLSKQFRKWKMWWKVEEGWKNWKVSRWKRNVWSELSDSLDMDPPVKAFGSVRRSKNLKLFPCKQMLVWLTFLWKEESQATHGYFHLMLQVRQWRSQA